jgi:hypothetical protein
MEIGVVTLWWVASVCMSAKGSSTPRGRTASRALGAIDTHFVKTTHRLIQVQIQFQWVGARFGWLRPGGCAGGCVRTSEGVVS